jgi:hypothetical protein
MSRQRRQNGHRAGVQKQLTSGWGIGRQAAVVEADRAAGVAGDDGGVGVHAGSRWRGQGTDLVWRAQQHGSERDQLDTEVEPGTASEVGVPQSVRRVICGRDREIGLHGGDVADDSSGEGCRSCPEPRHRAVVIGEHGPGLGVEIDAAGLALSAESARSGARGRRLQVLGVAGVHPRVG